MRPATHSRVSGLATKLAALLALPTALAAWWLFGTVDLNRAPCWSLLVQPIEQTGEFQLYLNKDGLDPRYHAHDPLSERVRVEPVENRLRVTVPAEMRVSRSDWIVKISFSEQARREGVRRISLAVTNRRTAVTRDVTDVVLAPRLPAPQDEPRSGPLEASSPSFSRR